MKVKTGAGERFGTPPAVVTPVEQPRLTRMTLDYPACSHTTGALPFRRRIGRAG